MVMEPIGRTNCSVSCSHFLVNYDFDYIQLLTFYYNATGGYGLSLSTRQGDSAKFGIVDDRLELNKFILRIEWYTNGPKYTIVGFAGTI